MAFAEYVRAHKWKIVALFLLLFMFIMALTSSVGLGDNPGDSGTVDEVAHIPAGYSYDKYLDFRLNPEHPPLAKALAGLPLALNSGIKGVTDDWSWDGLNQWEAGWYILYEAGNDPAEVLFLSRLPMMILMLALGYFLFKWASELFGPKVGLLVLTLYVFYPDVLAHGRLVTTDIAAALGYVLTIYFFDKALRENTRKATFVAALAFGVAQLLKFSAFLLFAVLLFQAVYVFLANRKKGEGLRVILPYFKIYVWICLLSLIIVWLVYIPFVWNTPPAIEHQVIEMNMLPNEVRTLPLRNFLHLFESNVILRALGHYILGIFQVIGRVEGGNATFILGHLSEKSISWYFPVAWLLKTPISIIVGLFASLGYIAVRWKRLKKEDKFTLVMFLIPLIVYWAITMRGSLNIGIRHLMPTVPFVLLLIGYLVSKLEKTKVVYVTVGLLVVFMIGSTLSNYPNFIPYFNELTPRDTRHTRLIDSSLDWGQDLLRLKKFVDDRNINSIKVDYFGGSIPAYYIPQSREWHSSYGPTTGWLAISSTFYQSSKLYGPKEGKWSYSWLDSRKPDAIIGGSILVYNITDKEISENPPVSSYPITTLEYPQNLGEPERKVGL